MPRSKAESQRDLAPFEEHLAEVVVGGWGDYIAKYPSRLKDFHLRLQAMLVHSHMEQRARAVFTGVSGFHLPPPGGQTFFVDYDNRYRIRLHKLNPNFTIAYNMTLEAVGFLTQRTDQLVLPGMPDSVTNLNLGYVLNATKSGPASVHLVSPDGLRGYSWEWTLKEAAAVGGTLIRLPTAPSSAPAPLVRPRRNAEKEVMRADGEDA